MTPKTDRHWKKWSDQNPYFGVLGVESDSMNCQIQRKAFNESGVEHIDRMLEIINDRFGGLENRRAALDFGCGVGRMLSPLSTRFNAVPVSVFLRQCCTMQRRI